MAKKKKEKKNKKAQGKKVQASKTEEASVENVEIELKVETQEEMASLTEAPTTQLNDLESLEQALEAVIFASPKAVSLTRITRLFKDAGLEIDNLKTVLDSLIDAYKDRGLHIVKIGNSYQFRTNPQQAALVQKLVEDKPARLSQSALEVLAIIAYKQPIVRAEIDAVRGIDSGHLIKGLLEKNLIRPDGHAETVGRPLLYVTTPYFLEVFNLNSLDDLPSQEEFQRELGEGQEAAGGAEGDSSYQSVLSADPDFFDKPSYLASEPDRGDFDAPAEDTVELPDFSSEEASASENQEEHFAKSDTMAEA